MGSWAKRVEIMALMKIIWLLIMLQLICLANSKVINLSLGDKSRPESMKNLQENNSKNMWKLKHVRTKRKAIEHPFLWSQEEKNTVQEEPNVKKSFRSMLEENENSTSSNSMKE